jgi:hypothetical protein
LNASFVSSFNAIVFLSNIVGAPEHGSDLATGLTVGNVILGPVGLFLFLPTIPLTIVTGIALW